MKTQSMKKVAAVMTIALMLGLAAGQAGATSVYRPIPRPQPISEEGGGFSRVWLTIERGLWDAVSHLVV